MKKIFSICIWLLSFSISTNILAQDLVKKTTNPKLSTYLQKFISEKDVPGLCFSIINKNGAYQNYAIGYSDVENKTSMTENNTFFSGSIGKTYAVALVMDLVEDNKIDLYKKFIDYFPEVDWLLKLPNINDITIEMLLQYTSGLPRYVLKPEIWNQLHDNPDKVWTYEDRLSMIYDDNPIHAAGKGWAYSDTNYILLGMLIEKISQKGYYHLVESKILKPKDLNQTYPSLIRKIPNLAVGYSRMLEAFKVPHKTVVDGNYVFNPQFEWTGGGMASTSFDLAKWAKMYYEGQLFSKISLEKITAINPNGSKVMGNNSYGMGSFIFETKHGVAYGHSGFMPGYNSLFIYYPDSGIAASIQVNCDYAEQQINLTTLMDELAFYEK